MAISFFVLLGVIRHKGVEIQGGRGFHVERRSDCENRACQFGKNEGLKWFEKSRADMPNQPTLNTSMPNEQTTHDEQRTSDLTTTPSPVLPTPPARDSAIAGLIAEDGVPSPTTQDEPSPTPVRPSPATVLVVPPLVTQDALPPTPVPPPSSIIPTTPSSGTTSSPTTDTPHVEPVSPVAHSTQPIPPTSEPSYPSFITPDVVQELNSASDKPRWLDAVKIYLRLESQFPSRVSWYLQLARSLLTWDLAYRKIVLTESSKGGC